MTWVGTSQSNRTPSQDYAENDGRYWLKFESFEAIYAKIGIIANGLIGSAVFNGDYMFSQQGKNASDGDSTEYQNFNKSDPMNTSNSFRPNVCINFNTGEAWFGAGVVHFNKSKLSIGKISISDKGIVYGVMYDDYDYYESSTRIITLPNPGLAFVTKSFMVPLIATGANYYVTVKSENNNATLYYLGTAYNVTSSGVKLTFPSVTRGMLLFQGSGSNVWNVSFVKDDVNVMTAEEL